ncbi:MAG: AAA family ATPase [Chloroflexi bacterium]|nr:AAA family ATPase [Chloroflexota bacterium]
MGRACLLTGVPGVGKTSLLREILAECGRSAGGFFTVEVRQSGERVGFDVVTLTGEVATLARVGLRSPYRVGKYGVEVGSLERVGVPALSMALGSCDIVVCDEIGRMELESIAFREAMNAALTSSKLVLGTIMLAPHPWADWVKAQPQVMVVNLHRGNRQQVKQFVLEWLGP